MSSYEDILQPKINEQIDAKEKKLNKLNLKDREFYQKNLEDFKSHIKNNHESIQNYIDGDLFRKKLKINFRDTQKIIDIKLETLSNIFINIEEEEILFRIGEIDFIKKDRIKDRGFKFSSFLYLLKSETPERSHALKFAFSFDAINWKNNFSIGDVFEFFKNNSYEGLQFLILEYDDSPCIYCDIDIEIFKKNTLREAIGEVMAIFLEELNKLDELKKSYLEIFYKIDRVFKTGIKQYITYFNDYVMNTKGLNINFEMENHPDGLIIKLDRAQEIHKIEDYFIEYMDFLRYEKVEDIKPKYEITKTDYEITFEKMELQSEINNLKHKCDKLSLQISHRDEQKKMLEEKINYHENMNEFFKRTINNMIENSKNFSSLSSGLVINNTNTSTITNNINIETKEIENFQNNINEIKKLLKGIDNPNLEDEKNEIEKIDDEILDVTNVDELKGKKKYFNLYKRFINNINDENSTLNNTIKATVKGKELLNKVKPLIPAMLSNINKLAEFF